MGTGAELFDQLSGTGEPPADNLWDQLNGTAPPPAPEAIAEADTPEGPDDSILGGMAAGALTGLVGTLTAVNSIFDPMAPIKRKYGVPTEAEKAQKFQESLAADLGVDLGQREGAPRVAQKVTEELVAAVIPSGMLFRSARKLHASGKQLHRFVAPFVKAAATRPGAFFTGEAVAATGAGLGRTAAPEGPLPQLGGAVIGSFSPALLAVPIRIVGGVVGGAAKLRPSSIRSRSGATAAERAQDAAADTPRAIRELDATADAAPGRAGFQPSSAQASQDKGLARLEQSEMTGPLEQRIVDQRVSTQEVVVAELRDLNRAEQGADSIIADVLDDGIVASEKEVFDRTVVAKQKVLEHQLDEEIAKAQGRVQALLDGAASTGKPEGVSEGLYQMLEQEHRKVFSGFSDEYDAVDEFGAALNAEFNTAPIRKAVQESKRMIGKAEKSLLPDDLRQTLDDFDEWEPFSELRSLSRRLSRELDKKGPEAISRGVRKALTRVKEGVATVLKSIEEKPKLVGRINPNAVELQGAKQAALGLTDIEQLGKMYANVQSQFGAASERMRKGVAGQILRPQGAPPVASATMDLFFNSRRGATEAARSYKAATRDLPEAAQMMDDFIVNQALIGTADPRTGITSKSVDRWLARHDAALREFPAAREKVRTATALQRNAEKIGIARKVSLDEFQETAAARFMRAKTPRLAVKEVIESANPARAMTNLKRQVASDPDALAGLRRVFLSEMEQQAIRSGDIGNGTSYYVQPQVFLDMINKWEKPLKVLFGEGHVRNLRRVQGLSEIAFSGVIPKNARNIQRNLMEGVSLNFMWFKWLSPKGRLVQAGRAMKRFLKNLDFGASQHLIDEAIANPVLMRELLTTVTPKNERGLVKRFRTHLATLGYRVGEEEEEDQ